MSYFLCRTFYAVLYMSFFLCIALNAVFLVVIQFNQLNEVIYWKGPT